MRYNVSWLREYRMLKGLSVKDLSEACGISMAGILRLENGSVKNPRPSTVKKLSKALGKPMEEFIESEHVS